jgi:hypothetical protein
VTAIAYAKWIGIATLIAAIAVFSFRQGGLASEAKLAAFQSEVQAQHVVQLQAVVHTMTEHDNAAAEQHAADRKVIDAYDTQKSKSPVTAGVVERMRVVEAAACSPSNRVLPSSGSVASGAESTGRVPRSDAEGDRLLQAALDAADRDADRLNAVVKLAP